MKTINPTNPFEPSTGERVWVCLNGKWNQGGEGVVIQRRGHFIQVCFPIYGEMNHYENQWFVRTSPNSFGAYYKKGKVPEKMNYTVFDKGAI